MERLTLTAAQLPDESHRPTRRRLDSGREVLVVAAINERRDAPDIQGAQAAGTPVVVLGGFQGMSLLAGNTLTVPLRGGGLLEVRLKRD